MGRDPAVNPLGTFVTQLTDFSFSGELNGNTFVVKRNTANTSAGSTTILQATLDPVTYEVSGTLEIFALYSFNGSPFMPAPPRTADLTPTPDTVPEPATSLLAGAILLGAGVASRRRRVRP